MKKYSNVPNKFLDDFFNLINYKELESTEKIIDLDQIIKWLDINKHKAKETLKKSYRKNIDYIIKKVYKPKGKGGQNCEQILLTIRCFKKFCQLTRSKHGDDVRNYFIDVETDDAKTVESCIKIFAKKYQYRKYKEVYEVNINILKSLATKCEKIKLDINDEQKIIEMEEDKNKKYYINISK